MPSPANLAVGLVYETHDSYAKREGDPHDFHVEYEPESTVEALEEALRSLGHTPSRLGPPHALLGEIASGALERRGLDAALCIAEGYGSRNREAWAPVLLEMAGLPMLGSDALTLSLSLDKAWGNARAQAAGIPIARQCSVASADEARGMELPADFPLFVKPRWEGTSKGIRRSSRVEDRQALVCEVARIVADYRQPALIEEFLAGPEYTVTVFGNEPPQVLPALQRAIEAETRIGVHALDDEAPAAGWRYDIPGSLDVSLESELQRLALLAYESFECLDFARVDFRLRLEPEADRDRELDAGEVPSGARTGEGTRGGEDLSAVPALPVFLEINPLPTFATDGSFAILAELEGRSLVELLADVFQRGLERLDKLSRPRGGS